MTPEDQNQFYNDCIAIAKDSMHNETHSDYSGLPSSPISIYHTGDPEAQLVAKEARPVRTHPITSVWRELGQQIYDYFDSIGLKWTSIDPVHFGKVEKEASPLFIWVGVMPGTLSREDAMVAAVHCKDILTKFNITGVEIAFRESVTKH